MSPAAWREHVERVVREAVMETERTAVTAVPIHRIDGIVRRAADRLSAPVLSVPSNVRAAVAFVRREFMRDGAEGDSVHLLCDFLDRLIAEAKPPATVGEAYLVCSTCRDTHQMALGDRVVMCTRCPTPCQTCRGFGGGAYCKTTPCGCSCHVAGAKP